MFDHLDLGEVALIQDLKTKEHHFEQMYKKGLVPWAAFPRDSFPKDDPLFNHIKTIEPKVNLVVFSIVHTLKMYC